MSWLDFFFSFQGRANRFQFWLMVLVTGPIVLAGCALDVYRGEEPFEGGASLLVSLLLLRQH